MGKNETSAILEAYLLTCMRSGTMVKAAPTYRPQIIHSRLRLLSLLENDQPNQKRIWKAHGYMVGMAPNFKVESQTGPRIMFFSASPDANIVGATASILLEVDEAQDVSVEKFNRDLRPMASTTNCTTVLYGTAWSDDTLLAQVKATNEELEETDGIKRHFQYDWTELAKYNKNYKQFVEAEIARLGPEHLTIRTQYCLQTISGAGFLLNQHQRYLLQGKHKWQDQPDEETDGYIVAGVDVGGEERPKQGQEMRNTKRDSTIITLARVSLTETLLPALHIIHQIQWTGMAYSNQYANICAICEQWNVRRLVIDRTGLGEMMASYLLQKFGEDRILPFHFTRPSKSKLTYQFLSLVNSGRLKMYSHDRAPDDIYQEAWKQLKLARYRVPGEGMLDMYVSPDEGHDDFLISMALCSEALREWATPIVDASIIRPRVLYSGESRY